MHDDHHLVRCSAAQALAEMQETQAIPLLIPALTDHVWVVKEAAGRALLKFGDKDAVAISLLTDQLLSLTTKLDTLEAFIKIRFHIVVSGKPGEHEDICLDYRSPSVEHYCQELLQKEIPRSAQEAIQKVLGEIRTRCERQILLRASTSDSKAQELLRGVGERPVGSAPEEMLRASEKLEGNPAPRSSWFERLFRRRR